MRLQQLAALLAMSFAAVAVSGCAAVDDAARAGSQAARQADDVARQADDLIRQADDLARGADEVADAAAPGTGELGGAVGGGNDFAAAVEARTNTLEQQYQRAGLTDYISYACKAKSGWELGQADSLEEAVTAVALDVGGDATFAMRVYDLAYDMSDQSLQDQITEGAVFALCEKYD